MEADSRRYEYILKLVTDQPWAILPEKLAVIMDVLALRASGGRVAPEQIQAVTRPEAPAAKTGKIGVLPVYGVLYPRANLLTQASGGTSVELLSSRFRDLAQDSRVETIVLDIDSPGGSVARIPEFASQVFAAREIKPVIAVANGMAASAAYWIASAASEVVATPSGLVGSIGVISSHDDLSKALEQQGVSRTLISAGRHKTEGHPYGPLSDEARSVIQSIVDHHYQLFVQAVAQGRGVAAERIRNGFGQGRVVTPPDALAEGMIDRIETLDDTLLRLGGDPGSYQAVSRVMSPGFDARMVKTEMVDDVLNNDSVAVHGDSTGPQSPGGYVMLTPEDIQRIRDSERQAIQAEVALETENLYAQIRESQEILHRTSVRQIALALQGRGEHEAVALPAGHAFAPIVVKQAEAFLAADFGHQQAMTLMVNGQQQSYSVTDIVLGLLNAVAGAEKPVISLEAHGVQNHVASVAPPSQKDVDQQVDNYLARRSLQPVS